MEKPDDTTAPDDAVTTENATGNATGTQATHDGQTLVSEQTITHEYLTLSGRVARETVKTNDTITAVMDFIYDESGRAFALNYSTDGSSFTTYYYVLNLQGDVVKLVTSSGSIVAEYSYDAWGNLLVQSGSMADKNPLRYRGYYYDNETGFYYLQSRYYDPTMRRFLNADAYASTDSTDAIACNMFAYCGNNPLISSDPSGCWYIKSLIKWFAEEVAKPVIKGLQEKATAINFSTSRGLSASGTLGIFTLNAQIGTAFDAKGNVALQLSVSGGVTSGTPGGSVMGYRMLTNAPSISNLEGEAYQIGGAVGAPVSGVPLAVGVDFNIIPDASSEKAYYYGLTTGIGVGTPGGEFHTTWGQTYTVEKSQFNVFRVAKALYKKIMEW